MKRMIVSGLCIGAVIAAVVSLLLMAGAGSTRPGRSGGVWTDGRGLRMPAEGVPERTVVWTEPQRMNLAQRGSEHEFDPTVDQRETRMVFVRGRPGFEGDDADLYETEWNGEGWGEPREIATLNTDRDEIGPELSRDGSELIFASDRPGGLGGFDLWRSERTGDGWGEPVHLGPSVNSPFDEYDPALSPDGGAMYFASDRPRAGEGQRARDAWGATVRERSTRGDFNLYAAVRTEEGYALDRALDEANSGADEGTPAVSPAGDFVYFASDRAGGEGGLDLYRLRVLADGYGAVERAGRPLNTAFDDLDPSLTAEGFAIVFSSDRGGEALSGGGARFDLYRAVSRELFPKRAERRPWDWAAIWAAVWPWALLLLLLALLALLLLLLRRLAGDARLRTAWRRLSLLARCVLVSLLIHALLLALFTVWHVTTALQEYLRPHGGVQVSLAPSGMAETGVYDQVRGGATDVAADTVTPLLPSAALPRMSVPEIDPPPPSRVSIEVPNGLEPLTAEPATLAARTPAAAEPEVRPPLPQEVRTPRSDADAMAAEPTAEVAPAVMDAAVRTAAPAMEDAGADPPAPVVRIESPFNEPPVAAAMRRAPAMPQTSAELPDIAPAAVTSAALPTPMAGQIADEPEARTPFAAQAAPSPMPRLPTLEDAISNPEPARARIAVESAALDIPASLATRRSANHSDPPPESAPEPAATAELSVALPEPGRDAAAMENEIALNDSALPRLGAPAVSSVIPPMGSLDGVESLEPGRAVVVAPDGEPVRIDVRIPVERPALESLLPEVNIAMDGLALPHAPPEPAQVYPQRAPEARRRLVEEGGGGAKTEEAVARALDWLARHQHPDGRWSSRGFDDGCGSCDGPARYEFDVATTGLALLCFLGADHGPTNEKSEHAERVRRAVAWLAAQQKDDGDLRGGGTMYTHGIATIALCEAYAVSQDASLKGPIARAAAFIVKGRNTRDGGWRYEPGQEGDTSVLGWQVMALESARRCGVEIDPAVIDGARAWLDGVSTPAARGRYAYQRGMPPTMSMTAEGMFVQQLLGLGREDARMRESAAFLLREPPEWQRDANTYGWYYATLALYQHGGQEWKSWNGALVRELLAAQRRDGAAAGSWDPADQWSDIGGRVYQTALCTLSLEVYYRYLPMYVAERADPGPVDEPIDEGE